MVPLSQHPPQSNDSGFPIHEIWGIILCCIAVFVGISLKFPDSTGLIGYWLVEVGAKSLMGTATLAFPVYLGIAGFGLLWNQNRVESRPPFGGIILSFIAFTIILEVIQIRTPQPLTWPIRTEGGGLIGAVGHLVLMRSVGQYGMWVVLVGSLLISSILIFGLSAKKIATFLFYDSEVKPAKSTAKTGNWFKKLVQFLFFTSVQDEPPVPEKTPRSQTPLRPTQKKQKKPDKPVKKRPTESPRSADPPPAKTDDDYPYPNISLLQKPTPKKAQETVITERETAARTLEETLSSFNVDAQVVEITPGPAITRYELKPGTGVKISKITALSKDLALKLAVPDVRIEAPIPGKALIGIEVPNTQVDMVTLRQIIDQTNFYSNPSKLICAVGQKISGEPVLMDLAKLPHVLIAGATGSGKSVCINTVILSILLRTRPDDVKFLMIDPKKVELNLYDGIPHLLAPVVTDPHKAAATLKKWALKEMEDRYETFSQLGVKNIEGYNTFVKENPDQDRDKLPYIVVIIDELADLMMVASQEVENTICRLAQMSRATGIHLVIATQRPSVNVITGLIKANVPSRISFFLQSQIDSRTILDMPGAEKLMGKGDMLFSPVGTSKPQRVQGVFISESEVKAVVKHLKNWGQPEYLTEIIEMEPIESDEKPSDASGSDTDVDALFEEAKNIVMSTQHASTSYLQRKLRIGYNRAARIMDQLEEQGVISEYVGEKKARSVRPS